MKTLHRKLLNRKTQEIRENEALNFLGNGSPFINSELEKHSIPQSMCINPSSLTSNRLMQMAYNK